MSRADSKENEIKLRVASAAEGLSRLERAGFRVTAPRVFESNCVYDTPERTMRDRHSLIRLRRVGAQSLLTFKGVPAEGPHKNREEIETAVADGGAMHTILERLGLAPSFRYEKYRTELQAPGGDGTATVDETPIGCFLELEGPPEWVDRTAAALGFAPTEYITASYASLQAERCRERNREFCDMVFA